MSAVLKRPYRTPTREAYAEVSLSEFSREEVEAYLQHLDGKNVRGPDDGDDLTLSGDDLDRIATLILCGQREQAREWVCGLISERIGRTL